MEGLDKSKFDVEFIYFLTIIYLHQQNLISFTQNESLKVLDQDFVFFLSVNSNSLFLVRKIKNIFFFLRKYLFLINFIEKI